MQSEDQDQAIEVDEEVKAEEISSHHNQSESEEHSSLQLTPISESQADVDPEHHSDKHSEVQIDEESNYADEHQVPEPNYVG